MECWTDSKAYVNSWHTVWRVLQNLVLLGHGIRSAVCQEVDVSGTWSIGSCQDCLHYNTWYILYSLSFMYSKQNRLDYSVTLVSCHCICWCHSKLMGYSWNVVRVFKHQPPWMGSLVLSINVISSARCSKVLRIYRLCYSARATEAQGNSTRVHY